MLARHHNVPFRRDVIERAAKECLRVNAPPAGADRQFVHVNELTGTMADLLKPR